MDVQLIWQCGKLYFEEYKKYNSLDNVQVHQFINRMDLAYAAANIIISRAIRLMPIFEKCETVHFDVKIGPRNLPALKWINQLTNEVIDTNNLVTIDKNVFEMFNPVDGVKMRIKNG